MKTFRFWVWKEKIEITETKVHISDEINIFFYICNCCEEKDVKMPKFDFEQPAACKHQFDGWNTQHRGSHMLID